MPAKIKDRALTKADLTNPGSAAIIGMVIVRQLIEFGQSSAYVDDQGVVCFAAPGELSLDGIPEEMAINTLVGNGWDEGEIATYLKGRDARMKQHV